MKKHGMNEVIYFLDTYAFFEIIRGNPAYRKYVECGAITCIFNLAELNYNLKKEKNKKIADSYTDKYRKLLVEVQLQDVKAAMDLKIKKKTLSIPDAIGYTVAIRHKARFLTGDEDFKSMPWVEYVK